MNLVIPEAIRIIQSKIKVSNTKPIPAFDPTRCKKSQSDTFDESYQNEETDADFVLFLFTINQESGILAQADFCHKGGYFASAHVNGV